MFAAVVILVNHNGAVHICDGTTEQQQQNANGYSETLPWSGAFLWARQAMPADSNCRALTGPLLLLLLLLSESLVGIATGL